MSPFPRAAPQAERDAVTARAVAEYLAAHNPSEEDAARLQAQLRLVMRAVRAQRRELEVSGSQRSA